MAGYSFTLAFSQITCLGCGVDRVRGIDCADCGRRPAPWEVDIAGATRRQAASTARVLLSQTVPVPASAPMDAIELLHADIFERLTPWIGSFFRGLSAAAEGNPQDLEDAVSRLLEVRAIVLNADDGRPQRALIRVLRALVGELESMADSYLAALLASSPLRAQELGRTAQQHLDNTKPLIEQSSGILDVIKMAAKLHDVEQMQSQLLDLALKTYAAQDFIGLDNAGRNALRKLLPTSRSEPGSGLLFALYNAWARFFVDADRFQSVVLGAYQVFRSNPSVLQMLAIEPLFKQDLGSAICELFDSSFESSLVIHNAIHSRQAGRALLGIATALVEGPGQVVATALLLACGRKSAAYANLRKKNATELVKAAQGEQALLGLLDGLDCDLRTARAHSLVKYEQDFAEIGLSSGARQIAWKDVVNGVFEGQESILACQVALLHAMGELGYGNFALSDLWRSMGMSADQVAAMILKGMGCHDVKVKNQGTLWDIDARAGSSVRVSSLVALLMPVLPGGLENLSITVHQNSTIHVLAGPIVLWRAYFDAPEGSEERDLAFVRGMLGWTYDGQAWISREFARKWVSGQAADALNFPPIKAISKLRALRELALFADDNELALMLNGAMRKVRLADDSSAVTELAQLVAWAGAAVPAQWWQSS